MKTKTENTWKRRKVLHKSPRKKAAPPFFSFARLTRWNGNVQERNKRTIEKMENIFFRNTSEKTAFLTYQSKKKTKKKINYNMKPNMRKAKEKENNMWKHFEWDERHTFTTHKITKQFGKKKKKETSFKTPRSKQSQQKMGTSDALLCWSYAELSCYERWSRQKITYAAAKHKNIQSVLKFLIGSHLHILFKIEGKKAGNKEQTTKRKRQRCLKKV